MYTTSDVLTQLKVIVANWDTSWAQDFLAANTTFSPDLGWDGGAMRQFRRLVNATFGIELPATAGVVRPTQSIGDYRKLVNAALRDLQRIGS